MLLLLPLLLQRLGPRLLLGAGLLMRLLLGWLGAAEPSLFLLLVLLLVPLLAQLQVLVLLPQGVQEWPRLVVVVGLPMLLQLLLLLLLLLLRCLRTAGSLHLLHILRLGGLLGVSLLLW